MQLLDAGGIPAFTDGKRQPDDSNQRGYYEHERVKRLASERDQSWLAEARGRAIKVIVPLVKFLPRELPYRMVFMERDIGEIMASQEKMIAEHGRSRPNRNSHSVAKVLLNQTLTCWAVLSQFPNAALLRLRYHDFVEAPEEPIQSLYEFLNMPDLNQTAMATVFTRELYRSRSLGV